MQVGSLIEAKLKPDVSLQEEVERNWSTILEQEPAFDQREKEVRITYNCCACVAACAEMTPRKIDMELLNCMTFVASL